MTLTTPGTLSPSASGTAAAVFVLEPPRHGGWQPIILPVGKYIVGSAEDCQVRIPVEGILPHHALLIVGERKTFLKAWDDHTWINEFSVKESVVRPGDSLSFGPVTWRWRIAKPDDLLAAFQQASVEKTPASSTNSQPIPPATVETATPSLTEIPQAPVADSDRAVPNAETLSSPSPSPPLRGRGAGGEGASVSPPSKPLTLTLSPSRGEETDFKAAAGHDVPIPAPARDFHIDRIAEEVVAPSTSMKFHEHVTPDVPADRRILDWDQQLSELSAREQALQDQQQSWSRRQEQAQLRDRQLAAWNTELTQREADLAAQLDRQARQQLRLEELTRSLDLQAEELSHQAEILQDDVASHRQQAETDWQSQATRLAAAEQELAARITQVELRESAAREREAAFDDQQRQFESAQAALQQQQDAWQAQVAETEQRLQAETASLQTERARCEQSQADAARQLAELAEGRLQLADAEQTLHTNHAQFAADREALAEAQSAWQVSCSKQAARQQAAQNALETERRQLDEQTARLEADRQDVEHRQQQLQVQEQALEAGRQQLDANQSAFTAEQAAWQIASEDRRASLMRLQTELDAERDRIDQCSTALEAEQFAWEHQQQEFQAAEQTLETGRQQLDTERAAFTAEHAAWEAARAAQTADREQFAAVAANIESDRQAFDQLQQQLAAAQEVFTDEQAAWQRSMQERETLWAERQQELAAERDRLAELAETLEADRQASPRDLAVIAQQSEQLSQQQRELSAARAEWERQRTDFAMAQDEALQHQQRLQDAADALQAEREAWQQSQAAQEQDILHRQQTLTAAADKLAAERAELSARLEELGEQEARLTELCDKLDAEQASAQRKSQEQADRESAASQEIHAELERLQAALNEERDTRAVLANELDGLRESHQQELALCQAELEESTRRCQELQQRLDESAQQGADLGYSLSSGSDRGLMDEYRPEPMTGWSDSEIEDRAPTDYSVLPDYARIGRTDAELDLPPVESPSADPVLQLRAELAKMFDLSEHELAAASAADATTDQVELDNSDTLPGDTPADAESVAGDAWRNRLSELMTADAAQDAAASPESVASEEDDADASVEEDSIASYMERLLARNRRGQDDPDDEPVPSRRPKRLREEPQPQAVPVAASVEPTEPMPAAPETKSTISRRDASKPRPAVNKDAVRENLEAFRQVANISARTAVAKHTTRTLRMTMAIKGIAALLCAAGSGVFFYAVFVEQQAYLPQAMGCLIMAGFVGAMLLKDLIEWYSMAKRPRSSSQGNRADTAREPAENSDAVLTELKTPGDDESVGD